jgi:hypothetical protein
MEGYCSTGQSPQRAVEPVEEEEEDSVISRKRTLHSQLCENLKLHKYAAVSELVSEDKII